MRNIVVLVLNAVLVSLALSVERSLVVYVLLSVFIM